MKKLTMGFRKNQKCFFDTIAYQPFGDMLTFHQGETVVIIQFASMALFAL